MRRLVHAQGWRGKAISDDEEREFFRQARALNIRISPYFRRSKARTNASAELNFLCAWRLGQDKAHKRTSAAQE